MGVGMIFIYAGIAFYAVAMVIAIFAIRRFVARRRTPGILLSIAAITSLLAGNCGIQSAYRSRQLQLLTLCVSQLRGIASAASQYEQEKHRRPDSLHDLVKSNLTTPDALLCPLAWTDAGKRGDMAAAYSDYSFVPDIVSDDPGHWIVAFDNGNHHGDGSHSIVCLDGSAHVLKAEEFSRRLDEFVAEFTAARKTPPRVVK